MSQPYQPGDAVRLTWALDDPGTKQPAAGATVTLTVAPPNGPIEQVAATETDPGRWQADVLMTTVGQWAWRWTATGTVQASDSGVLYVEPHVQGVA